MRLTVLSEIRGREVLVDSVGSDPTQESGIADFLRAEVSARGSSLRSASIRRVARAVAPAIILDPSVIADVCEELERAGDFQTGEGGTLFATPVRAVDLSADTFRVVCSLPTSALSMIIPGAWTIDGIARTCEPRKPIEPSVGTVLSASVWAGFDRTPAADENWLSSLDRRLQSDPQPPGSLERDEQLVWIGLVASDARVRWTSKDTGESTKLWRARNRWGYWVHAWTAGRSPEKATFVSLRPDEGTRTVFAVGSALQCPVTADLERRTQDAVLTVSVWVPAAEYRYLSISAAPLPNKRTSWVIPVDRVTIVTDILQKRLGLAIREVHAG
jgi:hypothetical protein